MKMKKLVALIATAAMTMSLAACGAAETPAEAPAADTAADTTETTAAADTTDTAAADTADTADIDYGTGEIKVWVADAVVDFTKSQIDSFVAENPQFNGYTFTVEAVGEGDAAGNMITDVEAGADIYAFAQDQIARLVTAGALEEVAPENVDIVTSQNDAGSVAAATVGSTLYAYPLTSDNGYFLYYDKTVISDEDAKDMTKILADCKAKGKKLNFEARSNGFYAASYFLAEGLDCHSNWTLDEITGKFTEFDDNFSGENGVIAAKGLKELADTSIVATNSLASKLGDTAAAVVSGIWEYDVAVRRLGANLGCAELPSFTVDGQSYHLGSYDGYKLLGVKPQVDAKKASVCRKLAQYLTGELCQTQRFKEVSWGPTNKKSSQKDEVLAHPGLAALNAQHEFATQQGQCPGAWFVALSTTAKAIKSDSTDAQLKAILTNYKNGLDELLDEDQEVRK